MIGQTFNIVADCPKCGNGMKNGLPKESAFWNLQCVNENCSLHGVAFLVEKSTAVCVGCSTIVDYEMEPMWPADLVNRKFEYVIRGGKPVPTEKNDAEFMQKAKDAVQGASARLEKMDTAEWERLFPRREELSEKIKSAVQSQSPSPVLPEPLEKMAWDFFYNVDQASVDTIKSALYEAYRAGVQSERSNTMAGQKSKV